MYEIVNKITQYGSTKTPITSELRIFSLNQTYIIAEKLFTYIILSFLTILLIKYFSVLAQEGPLFVIILIYYSFFFTL